MTPDDNAAMDGNQQPRRGLRWVLAALLWAGLLLCALVVWRLLPDMQSLRVKLTPGLLVLCLSCLVLSWLCNAAAWRLVVAAIADVRLSWRSAIRQLGQLSVGKYIPGGVFGLLARVYDVEGEVSRMRLAAAGAYEQILIVCIATAAGAVLYACAFAQYVWLLLALLLVPALAVLATRMSLRLLRYVPIAGLRTAVEIVASSRPATSRLLVGASFIFLALLAWMAMTCLLCVQLFGLGVFPALGLAGSYGLALVAGMLVVVAPGGIGVREAAIVSLSSPWLGVPEAVVLAAMLRLFAVVMDLLAGIAGILAGRNRA